jgi:ABC-type arginine transport system permease subunit
MSLIAVLAQTEELAPLVLPPLAFAGIAAAIFITLAIISWSYRDVANRHSDKTSGRDHSAGH